MPFIKSFLKSLNTPIQYSIALLIDQIANSTNQITPSSKSNAPASAPPAISAMSIASRNLKITEIRSLTMLITVAIDCPKASNTCPKTSTTD